MLRPEWRLWPLSSFLGVLDLKTGVTIVLIFALLNKVAGVYGLIAVLLGAGGSFPQLSLYIYSVIGLVALVWGLKAVKQEDPKQSLYFAHLYFADHIFSTSWTVFFGINYWLWTPHDGARQINSKAQDEMIKNSNVTLHHITPEEREAAAMEIWNHEKGMAAMIIVLGWLCKIYFAFLLYSYASHLRKGSYRSLPLSRAGYAALSSSNSNNYDNSLGLQDEDEGIEDFYRVPVRTPPAHLSGHRRGTSHNNSITSFADFVSAPGRNARKSKTYGGSLSGVHAGLPRDGYGIEEEVLFDEDDMMTYAASSSSRAHSKLGTESSSTAVSDEERTNGYEGGKSRTARHD